jgi:hypothetical protein
MQAIKKQANEINIAEIVLLVDPYCTDQQYIYSKLNFRLQIAV